MLIKLTVNVSFCLIPDIVFIRWMVFNSKTLISKDNLVFTLGLKTRVLSTVDKKIWLFLVDLWIRSMDEALFIIFRRWVGSSINCWSPWLVVVVSNSFSFKFIQLLRCHSVTISYFLHYNQLAILSGKGYDWKILK